MSVSFLFPSDFVSYFFILWVFVFITIALSINFCFHVFAVLYFLVGVASIQDL